MELIKELENLGYKVELEGENISLTFNGEGRPDQNIIKPLLLELKTRKPEALKYLQDREQNKIINFASEAAKVQARLRQDGVAKIHSETLAEDVYFAVDDKAAGKAPRGAIVYELSELRELARGNLTGEDLKRIHLTKKVFSGKIVENTKNPFGNA
jgi:hypothetical protein